MNRSRRRRLALRVLAVVLALGAIGAGGIAFADDSSTVTPGNTVIAPSQSGTTTSGFSPYDLIWQ